MKENKIVIPKEIPYEDLVKSDEDREDMFRFYYGHVHMYSHELSRWILFLAPKLEKEYLEELHQETILRALEHRHQLRDIEKCKAWLFSIAKNVIIEHFNDMKRREQPVLDNVLEGLVDVSMEEEICIDYTVEEVLKHANGELLMECLKKLSKEQRIVIVRHHYMDESFEEISRKLRRNYNTVCSWYRRGLARMRRLILKEGGQKHE